MRKLCRTTGRPRLRSHHERPLSLSPRSARYLEFCTNEFQQQTRAAPTESIIAATAAILVWCPGSASLSGTVVLRFRDNDRIIIGQRHKRRVSGRGCARHRYSHSWKTEMYEAERKEKRVRLVVAETHMKTLSTCGSGKETRIVRSYILNALGPRVAITVRGGLVPRSHL